MLEVKYIFYGVFVLAYALSKCPWLDGSTTPYALVIMGILNLIMLAERLKFCTNGFVPRVGYTKAAIFIAGADQATGWLLALSNETREMKVYAGVEDLNAPTSEWMRRHLCRFTTLVKMDPTSKKDAESAARFVADTIGDSVLVGVVYAGHSTPKISHTVDVNDTQRCVEINAFAAVNLAKAFAPLLKQHKGRFVLLADMAGRVTIPSLLSYCTSQKVALQYATIIRKMLEKYKVTTHVVETMLFNFRKTQESIYHPGTSPITGKVVLIQSANHVDHGIYLIVINVMKACLESNPKERYLTTYGESFIDLLIRSSPACVHNRLITFYFNNFLVKKSS